MSDETSEAPKKMRGPRKPVQGKFEIEFLKEQTIPDRKPLVGGGGSGDRSSTFNDILDVLKEHPGTLAVVFTSAEPQEVYTRRATLLQAAERKNIKLDLDKTASRSFVRDGQAVKNGEGKELYALYVMVAVDQSPSAPAAQ